MSHNAGAFSKDNLNKFAQNLGLDMARFTPCLQNNETLSRVDADSKEARSLGFSGTPSDGHGHHHGKPLGRALVVVLHREDGSCSFAHQDHLRRVVEELGVGAADVEAAECVAAGGGEAEPRPLTLPVRPPTAAPWPCGPHPPPSPCRPRSSGRP